MFSVGEEFEIVIDEVNEYFSCIANLNLKGKEYIIAEDEEGTNRVFLYDSLDDEITVLMDEDEEEILTVWDEEYYGVDKNYMFWNEEYEEYDKVEKEESDYDNDDVQEVDEIEESEEDLEDFIENLLD